MKHLLFIFILVCISIVSYTQNVSNLKKYKCYNGWELKPGDSITLAFPLFDTAYESISQLKNDRKDKKSLNGDFSNKTFKIKSIKRYEWYSTKTEDIFADIQINNEVYYVNIERAIINDEIELPNGFTPAATQITDSLGNIVYRKDLIRYLIDSIPFKNGEIIYDRVIHFKGLKKEELFNRYREWFANSFKDSKWVLEINDKDAGQLMGKGNMSHLDSKVIAYNEVTVYFTISIYVKDEKIRYVLRNFTGKTQSNSILNGLGTGTNSPTISSEFDINLIYESYLKKGNRKNNNITQRHIYGILTGLVATAAYIDNSLHNDLKHGIDYSDF